MRGMNIGTKSLLFGCHQMIIHPLFVFIAWVYLFGWPNRSELEAILLHDIGYWGSDGMDNFTGSFHPVRSANWVDRWLGYDSPRRHEILWHSRWLCKRGRDKGLDWHPSRLMYADKLGTAMYPHWLWALLAHLSGEGYEYMADTKYEIHHGHWLLDADISGLRIFHKKYRAWCRTFLLCNLYPAG